MKLAALNAVFVTLVLCRATSAEPCTFPGVTYKVTESNAIDSKDLRRGVDLVSYTVSPNYRLSVPQSDYIGLARKWGEKQPYQRDIHDLYRWIESQQPSSDIYLELFDADHSERRLQFFMMLAAEGRILVKHVGSGQYVRKLILESYSCVIDDFAERGGRRLRTESNDTIFWTFDWIS